jgi:peptidoglycan/LPS O-acetylase OafA/YrhL
MIQRIQTIYMLLAAIASLLLSTILVIWYTTEGVYKGFDNPVYMFVAGVSAGVFFANIFNFKKRKLQVVLNRAGILLNLVLAGFMIWEYLTLVKAQTATGPGIGLVMPLLVIVLAVLANKAITKDEALVKSADRFR